MTYSYEAALEHLKSDAATWAEVSATYSDIREIVDGCTLGYAELDGMGKMAGAQENYNSSHELIRTLVSDASRVFSEISENLTQTKKNYEGADGHAQWLLDQG